MSETDITGEEDTKEMIIPEAALQIKLEVGEDIKKPVEEVKIKKETDDEESGKEGDKSKSDELVRHRGSREAANN